MRSRVHRVLQLAALGAACAAVAGCSSIDNATRGFMGSLAPYKIEVVQGNFVSSEQVELLKPGMTRQQVRELLGTPLMTSVFHADRWDYVFTLRRQGVEPQARRLTVFFKGDALERFEGDRMPSEAEFVASIGNRRKFGPVPKLEASDDQLQRSAGKPPAEPARPAQPQPAPPATSYPPLEPAGR
jgi:outer membrane protein assembly factor BamE